MNELCLIEEVFFIKYNTSFIKALHSITRN
jgi:hypothetical protein